MTGMGTKEKQEREKQEHEIAELASRIGTAYHESGHAVAAWHSGLKFERVTIKPNAKINSLGHIASRFPKWFDPDSEKSERIYSYGERHIVVDFAGQLAKDKFSGEPSRYCPSAADLGSGLDRSSAIDMALRLFGPLDTVEAYLKYCWFRSRDIVNRRWGEIVALATALLERETLGYWEALEVISPGSIALRESLMRANAVRRARRLAAN